MARPLRPRPVAVRFATTTLCFTVGGAVLGALLSWWGTAAGSDKPHGLVATTLVWAALCTWVGLLVAGCLIGVRGGLAPGTAPVPIKLRVRPRHHR